MQRRRRRRCRKEGLLGRLRVTTAGESHGPGEVCILEGIPAGLELEASAIDRDLARRQTGYGRGERQKIELDRCRFAAGVRRGRTMGTPICIIVENRDHANWRQSMAPEKEVEVGDIPSPLTVPRPGHADLVGLAKHGLNDIRDVLERASARETVARVAGGSVCRALLAELGVSIRGRVTRIGSVAIHTDIGWASPDSVDWDAVEASPVGCDDPVAGAAMCEAVDRARTDGDSLGGVFEVWCWGVCPGLGGYATVDQRLDGRLVGALGSIPAVKGVEIGPAFENATLPGSRVHDPLTLQMNGKTTWIGRETNRAGGLEGGCSTGMPIVLSAAMKPIPTLTKALPSVDVVTLEPTDAHVERSDVTAVPSARVVGEAMVAQIVAAAYVEKFGGDSLGSLKAAVLSYEADLEERGLWRRS